MENKKCLFISSKKKTNTEATNSKVKSLSEIKLMPRVKIKATNSMFFLER